MQGKAHTSLPQLSESNPHGNAIAPTKRVYQAWPGNNKFFFGGRLVFGPDVKSLFLTVSLIVVPAALFCVFVSAKLIDDSQHYLCNLIPTASTLFTAYIIVLLFLTSGRDPGIIPRNTNPPEPDDGIDTSRLPSDWIANHGTASVLPPIKDVVVNGVVVKVKYCNTCMLYRPPRCSHCSICNNCVERFDHHCPWVGQCIGKRNYRFFFMFVTSTTVFCLYVLIFCCLYIKKIMKVYDCGLWSAVQKSPVAGVLVVYTFIGAWFVGGLTTFHIYLICINQTTYENFRYRYSRKANPHNLGLVRNVREIFLSKIPSSKGNFRGEIKEQFSSPETKSVSADRRISLETPKPSILDIETGGRRQTVAEEELEDVQSQIGSVTSLERCRLQPRHSNVDDHKGNWEMSPDIQALAMEFGLEHESPGAVKVG